MNIRILIILAAGIFGLNSLPAQVDSTYKKRVLDKMEIQLLSSYYTQDGSNAAVTGGIGTEKLTDVTPTIVVSMPINDDDVLTVDLGISAYTSASSSNVNPFDGSGNPDAFQASSGASSSDTWTRLGVTYAHSSDNRNTIWTGGVSVSSEYDYFSAGVNGSMTKLFNQKNTEFTIKASAYFDTWSRIYPQELRGESTFLELNSPGRNSYSAGFNLSQILSRNLRGSLALDVVQQQGLLSTPFQRVYFSDLADRFQQGFHLADDIERLPDTRFKIAAGGRLNYFINENVSVRTFGRYYTDDWGINSVTASIEVPVKLSDKWAVYPSYRYYDQTAADHFAPYNQHLSTSSFYTSDFDLSANEANQFGFGVSYTDVYQKLRIRNFGLKSVDLRVHLYERDTGLKSTIGSIGLKFGKK